MSLAWLASAAVAHAQDELDEAPERTLAEAPEPSALDAETSALADRSEAEALGPKAADRKARDEFELGRAAWEEGEYHEAWNHWHLSYRLSGRPELLYNVGQAADRLRMDREALAAFRMYLEKNPKAKNRREIEKRIRILEEQIERDARDDKAPEAEHPYLDDDAENEAQGAGTESSEAAAAGGSEPPRSEWYLRASLGLGIFVDAASDTAGNPVRAGSGSIVLDAWVGYGVHERVAVGGALLLDQALSPSASQNGGAGQDLESLGLAMLAVYGDYYFEPRKNGFHLIGGLGLGTLSVSDKSATFGNEDGGGAALIAGAGYEWPMGGKWAVGVLGRIVLGRFSTDTHDHTIFAPSVSATAAFY